MQNLLKLIIYLMSLPTPLIVVAQEQTASMQLENLVESIIDNLGEDHDATMIIEDLQELSEQPVNINAASSAQLSRLHLLNSVQIQKLLDYIKEYGPAYSLYELNAIEGLDKKLLENIKPFIYFGSEEKKSVPLQDIIKYGRHELILRTLGTIQKSRGYQAKDDGTIPFEGNRARYYARYRFRSDDNLSMGITAEKDPGESFFCGSNKKGFDFYSAHLSMKISSLFENITIGDYIVRAGQGLVLWQGFSSGKSAGMNNISKNNQSIRPFTSANENNFFRGIASTFNFGKKKISLFFSRKKRDGNLAFPDSAATHFTSLQTSGYHRTKNEIADKNSVNDMNAGVLATWRFNNLNIGATFLYRKFNMPFMPAGQLYNYFRFKGKTNVVAGADYFFSKDKYQIFGEAAISKSKGKAFLQGFIAKMHDQLNFSLLFRHFDKNYHALWASALSETSTTRNESGLYTGVRILPVKFVTITAYCDIFRSKWINYTTTAPSNGQEFQIQTDFRFSEKLNFYIRFRNKKRNKKSIYTERYISLSEQYKKTRIHFQYSPCETLKLKTRLEHVFYEHDKKENGWMVFQDLQFSPGRIPLDISARIAWFDTQSYNSRIYAYENDLLYTFSIPAYFDKGIRTYLNMKYKIGKKTEIWFKMGKTILDNAETMGSGYNEIKGNKKTEVKLQMRLKI